MEAIATLPNLKVFHLSVWDNQLAASYLAYICRHVPPQLSVLSLSSGQSGCSDDRSTFSDLWAYFTDLSFLNLRIRGSSSTALTVQEVIRGAKRLQLVGYEKQLREVVYGDGGPVALPAWSARKVKLCEIEDFGCESWNWVIRHLVL
ncbi:uncharacterized protein B0H18DRAFT_1015675 [Fomitopsis serialis]|uniref:uncharacterized protein n=1 Tax=Fomitopsis serialis TaxID=139415 RepID=UPI0020073FD7|nr:uncharacterized protein B0H18DRAFT_1015675 [Neoantrodia serialis]KAH9923030.1 hypothetical protein B0H18DRAFT_1015675 [Neoantrodia serialis]